MSNINQTPAKQVLRDFGGTRIKAQTFLLTHLSISQTAIANISVKSPSRRLSLAVEVFYEPDNRTDTFQIAYTGSIGDIEWNVYACAEGINTSIDYMYTIESTQAIPRMYEFDSAIKLAYFNVSLAPPLVGGSRVAGNWYARCYWEPNTPMSDDELRDLFSSANADIQVSVT